MSSKSPNEDEGRAEEIYTSLDFSGIAFPSDRISIQYLRRLYPDLFDHGFDLGDNCQPQFFMESNHHRRVDSDLLGEVLFAERVVAAYAYGAARGIPEPAELEGEISLVAYREDLVKYYTQLRLASGPLHAAELIRDIERHAGELAMRHSPSNQPRW